MHKNLPNIITIFRIILAPILFYTFFVKTKMFSNLGSNNVNVNNYYIFGFVFLFVYILVALLDNLDGYLARKYNSVSDFGKMLDPIADKTLFGGLFVCILISNFTNPLFILCIGLILFREVFITIFRFIYVKKNNVVIPANSLGKIKTIIQSVTIGFFIAPIEYIPYSLYLKLILLVVSVFISLISGISYIQKAMVK